MACVSAERIYNLGRDYEMLHAKKYNLQGQQRIINVNELLEGLKKQQSVFTHSQKKKSETLQ